MSRLDLLWAGWRSEYINSVTEDAGSGSAGPASGSSSESPAARVGGSAEPSGSAEPGRSASPESPGDPDGADCVFCRILSSDAPDEETHIVWRDPSGLVVALLNAYPYGSGHLMVMPVRHTGDLETLAGAEATALWGGVAKAVQAIKVAYRPDGLNVGANLGRAAGAGVPGHLHIHVLPRWAGDTNFMTAIAETRVLPEPLSVTADKLRRAWPG